MTTVFEGAPKFGGICGDRAQIVLRQVFLAHASLLTGLCKQRLERSVTLDVKRMPRLARLGSA